MDALRFVGLRRRIDKKKKDDEFFRKHINIVWGIVFGANSDIDDYVKEYSLHRSIISFVMRNKAFAQDVFLKKDSLELEIKKENAYKNCRIVIR